MYTLKEVRDICRMRWKDKLNVWIKIRKRKKKERE